MKISVLATALLLSAPVVAQAQDQQAYLSIFAETSSMKMVGVPAMPKLPPGVQLPPQVRARIEQFSKPQRKLSVRLWSPGIAPDNATAALAIPDGLKLGSKLDLEIYRPKPESGESDTGGPGGAQPFDPDMVIKRYWGSSATVRSGQPEVTEFKGLSKEQMATIRRQAARARQSTSYFYKPDWTTAYWPAEKAPGTIDPEAALTGHYDLTTSYTGNVAIDVPENVSFLAPIEMSSPDLEQAINFDEAMAFHWKNVPNALGLHIQIVGMQGKKTLILWSSSEVKTEMGMGFDYLQMSEVADLVKKQVFLNGDSVEATVPAGIFKDCDFVSLQMIGYGPGTALDKGQPLPRVQTKTTLMIMLGGKMMRNFPSGPPGRGGEPPSGDSP